MHRAFVLASCLGSSCVVLDPAARLCAIGSEGCACTGGGACDGGLDCRSGICTDPNVAVSGTDGGTTKGADDTGDPSQDGTGDDTDVDTSIDAMPNYVFVTSTAHRGGALGGLAGADAICQERADAAGLPGTYRAWLSSAQQDAKDRLGTARGWLRTDGKPFARDLAQVLQGAFYHPPMLDEYGNAPSNWLVWTATLHSGVGLDDDGGQMCAGWTSEDPERSALQGDREAGGSWWTSRRLGACNEAAHLYCFGIDEEYELEVEPAAGRRVFVTAGGVSSTQGVAAADALCQSEADAAGLSGSFLALMAVSQSAPADRFDLDGPPWVRMDGIPLFSPGEPLGRLETPITFRANGVVSDVAMAWLGSPSPTTVATSQETCEDWTSTEGEAPLATVFHVGWFNWGLGGGNSCSATVLALCFEQ